MPDISIRQALQHVADYPESLTDPIDMPAYEMIARTLFDIANRPDANERGSLGRANKARKMILDRLIGKRRAGTHPVVRQEVAVTFRDLTGGELE